VVRHCRRGGGGEGGVKEDKIPNRVNGEKVGKNVIGDGKKQATHIGGNHQSYCSSVQR